MYKQGGTMIDWEIIEGNETKNYYKVMDTRTCHRESSFFNFELMEMFNTKLANKIYISEDRKDWVFVTSEQSETDHRPLFTIRRYNVDLKHITNLGNFQQYTSERRAERGIKFISAEHLAFTRGES